MNGAESLVRSLIASGVEVCFANPGTSEMHFVAALDKVEGIRCVLGLFEGVVTGAADGYARMTDKPAVTLLHLGPGLGNGLANLHNAKKAGSRIVNIIGEHADWHIKHDAPLTADIESIARPVSHWVARASSATDTGRLGAEAVRQSLVHPGQIASLILPANTAWETGGDIVESDAVPAPDVVPAVTDDNAADIAIENDIDNCVAALQSGEPVAILLGNHAVRADALELAGKISSATGARLLAQTSNARFERGAGRVVATPVPYPVEQALELLKPFKHIILVEVKAPVAFFAYPNKPSLLYQPDTAIHSLAAPGQNGLESLRMLVDRLDINDQDPLIQQRVVTQVPEDGPLTLDATDALIAHHIPDNGIVVDESITSGRNLQKATRGCAAHDWLQICGGSIGAGFPLATGAAVACPDRQVLDLQADGSGMYTLQALWTQAREQLNVTTLVFANHRYAILQHELRNVEAQSGAVAQDMMRLDEPQLDWVALANGMGVEAVCANTISELHQALQHGLQTPGPYLIQANMA